MQKQTRIKPAFPIREIFENSPQKAEHDITSNLIRIYPEITVCIPNYDDRPFNVMFGNKITRVFKVGFLVAT